MIPYRLEMQARLTMEGDQRTKDLYEFWGGRLLDALIDPTPESLSICDEVEREQPVILNLASKEYSKAIEAYLTPDVRYVTCVFGVMEGGKVKVKATEAKMARGEMVRWMAEQQIEDVERLREFTELGYRFSEELSNREKFIYIKS